MAKRPFIWRENAHLDISFSCIALLNSCIPLLPGNSTGTQRAASIVQGHHGLEVYANMFWSKHLLAYCSILRQQHQLSEELLGQLQLLLRFRKDDIQGLVGASKTRTEEEPTKDTSLELLNHLPDIKRLVSDVISFRAKIKQNNASDKPLERKFLS